MARTYLTTGLPDLKEEYSEEALAAKFSTHLNQLRNEMQERNEEEAEALQSLAELKQSELKNIRSGLQPLYTAEEIAAEEQKIKATDNQAQLDEVREVMKYQQWLKEYGTSFTQLYQIKEEHEKRGESEKLVLTEIDLAENKDILTDTQYNKMNADPDGRLKELALKVEAGEEDFAIVFTEYHQPNSDPQFKAQLSFDEDTLAELNAEKLKRIFEFCERYGLSTADMSVRYAYDGSIDVDEELRIRQDRIEELTAQAKELIEKEALARDETEAKAVEERNKELQKEYETIVAANGGIVPEGLSMDDVSPDLPITEDSELLQEMQTGGIAAMQQQAATAPTPAPTATPTPAPTAAPATGNVLTQQKAEKQFEEWIGTSKGLNKSKGLSYWKRHTGLFGKGWAEFIVYPSEDKDNLRDDGRRDKDNRHPKWNYSFKLFVRVDENGKLNLAYRTPNSKRMDEDIIGGIAGQLKDLGYKSVNFPNGIPDQEKGMWRKCLAEKGIVPLGIGLDRSKAEGMLKAAKEKLSAEEYSDFKYRLGKHMDKRNKDKGKVVDASEQAFIDGLLNAHKYAAFTDGYSLGIKGEMKKILRSKDPMEGAIKKIAAFRALSLLFEVYQDQVDRGISLASNPKLNLRNHPLSQEEKEFLSSFTNLQKMSVPDMNALYLFLHKRMQPDIKKEMYADLIKEKYSRYNVARRAAPVVVKDIYNSARNMFEAINEELQVKGIEELGPIKAYNVSLEYDDFLLNYAPEYERRHPQQQQATPASPTPNAAAERENTATEEHTSAQMATTRKINPALVQRNVHSN